MLTTLLTQQGATGGVTANLSAVLGDATLSSTGTVTVTGISGDVTATLGALTLASTGTVVVPIVANLSSTLDSLTLASNATIVLPPVIGPAGDGDYLKPRKAKQREFKDERREREELRLLIEQAVDPIKARSARVIETEAEDGTTGIAIVTRGRQTAVPVPPSFDPAEVASMVAAALERAGIEARRVATEQARRKAVAALESAIQERQRLILKRRREEEILLLM